MIREGLSRAGFKLVHGRHLVYNQCWEDPRLDHQALELGSDDHVVMITSAGCNALDYALKGPRRIDAVDVNPRQNALLDLKLAGIRALDHEPFFELFGRGRTDQWKSLYQSHLRSELSPMSRRFWDSKGADLFSKRRRGSFYFRGTSGTFAWFVNVYINRIAKLRHAVNELLAAKTVEEQRDIFERYRLRSTLWKPYVQWAIRRDMALAMLGVPRAQRKQLDRDYIGGIAQFVIDRVEAVFTRLPFAENYFWRVYLTGEYTPECCPDYLRRDNFQKLKDGLADSVQTHTTTITGFLEQNEDPVTRYVLLDHMDWMSANLHRGLAEEWQWIVTRAAPSARAIWRSAGMQVDFIDPIEVERNGEKVRVGDLLTYNKSLAEELHARDRVHTYGSFYIAQFPSS